MNRVLLVIFSIVSFLNFSSPSLASGWCKADSEPQLVFAPYEDDVTIDNSRSFVDLSRVKSDTRNPYGRNSIVHTFGLAHREFRLEQKTELKILTNPNTRQTCLWYGTIDVRIYSKPVIYIAKEFEPGTCHYQEVLRHEMEHITVDREVTNKYLGILATRLRQKLGSETAYGPIRLSQQNSSVQRMQRRIESIVREVSLNMKAERDVRQSKIDSLGSYERSSRFMTETCDRRNPETAQKRDALLRRYVR